MITLRFPHNAPRKLSAKLTPLAPSGSFQCLSCHGVHWGASNVLRADVAESYGNEVPGIQSVASRAFRWMGGYLGESWGEGLNLGICPRRRWNRSHCFLRHLQNEAVL